MHPKIELGSLLDRLTLQANDEYFLNNNNISPRGFSYYENIEHGNISVTIVFKQEDRNRLNGYYVEHEIYYRSQSIESGEPFIYEFYNLIINEFIRIMLFLLPAEYYSAIKDKIIKCIPIQDLIKNGI